MILDKIKDVKGLLPIWSGAYQEKDFRYFLEKAKPKVALEIGTFQGVSTALIAEYADEVHTVDILPQPWIRNTIWERLGVKDKIKEHIVTGSKIKKNLIDSIPFDFAFIDGSHMMESVMADYELAKRCGNLLFHDYWMTATEWPDVKEFIDGLQAKKEIKVPFAYVTF